MKRTSICFAIAAVVLHTQTLFADFTPVDFSSQANWTWSGYDVAPPNPAGVYIAGAPTGETTLGGIPFNITSNSSGYQAWNGYMVQPNFGTASITMNANVYGATNVYTLINLFWGQPGPNSYVALVFTGSGGATYTDNLIGNVDVRDYAQPSGYTDYINGTTTVNVYTGRDVYGGMGVLDMQDITLPPAFASQTLDSIELIDTGAGGISRAILDGVTVQSVPEPSETVLMLTGGLLFFLGSLKAIKRRAKENVN